MSQARRMLVVVAMTTALCADQIVVAAPIAQPRPVEVAQLAQRLVSRLSQTLRNAIPATALRPPRSEDRPTPSVSRLARDTVVPARHVPTNAFQFRLPPPIA